MPLVRKRTDHAGAANGSKRARIAPAYPCRVCKAECSYEQDCVQCDGCEAWMHTGCIRMNHDQYCLRCDHTLAVLLFAVFTRCKWPCQLPYQFEKNRQLGTRHPRMQGSGTERDGVVVFLQCDPSWYKSIEDASMYFSWLSWTYVFYYIIINRHTKFLIQFKLWYAQSWSWVGSIHGLGQSFFLNFWWVCGWLVGDLNVWYF